VTGKLGPATEKGLVLDSRNAPCKLESDVDESLGVFFS
jgi:hypothetical protein